jgi:hypothetical protein
MRGVMRCHVEKSELASLLARDIDWPQITRLLRKIESRWERMHSDKGESVPDSLSSATLQSLQGAWDAAGLARCPTCKRRAGTQPIASSLNKTPGR